MPYSILSMLEKAGIKPVGSSPNAISDDTAKHLDDLHSSMNETHTPGVNFMTAVYTGAYWAVTFSSAECADDRWYEKCNIENYAFTALAETLNEAILLASEGLMEHIVSRKESR